MLSIGLALFFFSSSIILFIFAFIFIDEQLYRRFIIKYAKLFGINLDKIPSTEIVPDPLMPLIKQGKFAGFLFIFLSIILILTGIFFLNLKG